MTLPVRKKRLSHVITKVNTLTVDFMGKPGDCESFKTKNCANGTKVL